MSVLTMLGALFGGIVAVVIVILAIFAIVNLVASIFLLFRKDDGKVDVNKLQPGQKLRKVEEIALEKFDGDKGKAIDYIMRNIKSPELDAYVKEFDANERRFAGNILYNIAEEMRGEETVNSMLKAQLFLKKIGMSEDDVINSKDNPFAKKLKNDSIQLLFAVVVIGVLVGFLLNIEIAEWGTTISTLVSCVGGFLIFLKASSVTENIMLAYKFKKHKKFLSDFAKKESEKTTALEGTET